MSSPSQKNGKWTIRLAQLHSALILIWGFGSMLILLCGRTVYRRIMPATARQRLANWWRQPWPPAKAGLGIAIVLAAGTGWELRHQSGPGLLIVEIACALGGLYCLLRLFLDWLEDQISTILD
ncbi:hypothetical protein HY933_00260 [Candidatus Falkowbacteria bacterium]|nr:hypothetical protein [Candidatus Falkowbacteria bacterium]